MNRGIGFFVFGIVGLALLIGGWLVPAHLRAVDGIVLQRAGAGTATLIEEGLVLVKNNQLGAAQLFFAAAQNARLTNANKLGEAVDELAVRQPALRISGSAESGSMGALLASNPGLPTFSGEPFTEFIVRSDNRTEALEWLQVSPNPLVRALLHFRLLTNTVLFPSSSSSSGQALDAAVCIGGLLAETGRFPAGLNNAMLALGTDANRGGNTQPLEEVLMGLLSLGQRFNWGQLATFVGQIKDVETLRMLSHLVRRGEGVPVLYAAVCLTGNAAGVTKYLANFSETGLNDLRSSLGYGAGGVNELLQRNRRLCDSWLCARAAELASSGNFFAFVVDCSRRAPWLALAGKWFLYLSGGFLFALAFHFVKPAASAMERPLQVRGFHVAREILFALGFLLMVLLLSEPFLAQDNQKGELPFRLRLPTVGNVVPAGNPGNHGSIMNQLSILTLLLFFVLQALLYTASVVKLAEIRRQQFTARIKLKLLENEDHLFDAGLYLGFAGTIISLILVSMGVIKPSLMAAYSATSFGIIFVSVFKIFNLRPFRRKLLLESENMPVSEPVAPTHPFAAPL